MGGCQNYGPFLGILNIRCRTRIRDPKRDLDFDNHPHMFDCCLPVFSVQEAMPMHRLQSATKRPVKKSGSIPICMSQAL